MNIYTHSCLECGTFLTDNELQDFSFEEFGVVIKEVRCPYCGGTLYKMDDIGCTGNIPFTINKQ